MDYFWGIDANVFGIHGPGRPREPGLGRTGDRECPRVELGRDAKQSAPGRNSAAAGRVRPDLGAATNPEQRAELLSRSPGGRSQLASLRSSLELSAESLRLTVLRYQAGEATALEVADAQSTLAQARNAYDDGLARYRLALATLSDSHREVLKSMTTRPVHYWRHCSCPCSFAVARSQRRRRRARRARAGGRSRSAKRSIASLRPRASCARSTNRSHAEDQRSGGEVLRQSRRSRAEGPASRGSREPRLWQPLLGC